MNIEDMKSYTASFTVTKSNEYTIKFFAPSDEVAAEMACDMSDDVDFVLEHGDENENDDVDSVELDCDPKPDKYQNSVCYQNRSIERWCDQWCRDKEV